MLTFGQMLARLVLAIVLGAIIGWERELVGKEAGIRTSLMISAGSAIFTLIAITLPHLIAVSPDNSGFLNIIANIVVGIGFIGAGIIFKTEEHVHGLTTAAVIWVVAGIGIMSGLGLARFAATTTILIAGLLFLIRRVSFTWAARRKV